MSERDSGSSRSCSPIDEDNEDSSPRDRKGDRRKIEFKPKRASRGSGKRQETANCRVHVSNIPHEFKFQDLKDLFQTKVSNVGRVEMFGGENRGCATVSFGTAELAKEAIGKLHQIEAKGRKLVVKADGVKKKIRGKDTDRGRSFNRGGNNLGSNISPQAYYGNTYGGSNISPQAYYGNTYGLSMSFLNSLGINGPIGRKVFVVNLDYEVSNEDLREAFQVAGKVNNCEVMRNSDGKSKGFGKVEYDHPLQAVQAISMLHNQEFFSRRISVYLDKIADKEREQDSIPVLPKGLKSLGMGLGTNGQPITDISDLSGLQCPNTGGGDMGPINTQMGMGGFNMGGNNMRSGLNPSMPGMGMDNMGMGGTNSNLGLGVPNVLNLATALSSMANAGGFGNQGGMNMPSSNATGPMFTNNTSNNFGNQTSSNDFGDSRCVVQISNLPMDYNWRSLKDLCRNYGDIKFAKIKSKGVGLVRFGSEAEARRTADEEELMLDITEDQNGNYAIKFYFTLLLFSK